MEEIATLLFTIILAGLIHTGFQLSVSALSLMSGHAIIKKRSQSRLIILMTAFIFGAVTMTILLLSTIAFFIGLLLKMSIGYELLMMVSVGMSIAIGLAVWIFYYDKGPGTSLWLPKTLANYVADRAKKTNNSGEAFTLGLMSVFIELPFILAPLLVATLAILQFTPIMQLINIVVYVLISMISLLIIWAMIGSGHSLSKIQQWREKNKRFLQFISGAALIVLGIYLYTNEILSTVVFNGGF